MSDVLISGGGIAGPALAFWLHRLGHRATVVEKAPSPRRGGYAVDFRGRAHLGCLARMGLLDAVRARQTHLAGVTCVDADDRPVAEVPAEIFAGDVEILRGDLVELLHGATTGTEYRFGETITALDEQPDGIRATFENAPPQRFDLVVGADGLHSVVRRLVFGGDPVRHLGLHAAAFRTANTFGLARSGRMLSVPGRSASIYATDHDRDVIAMFCWRGAPGPRGTEGGRSALTEAFDGLGWHVPELLRRLPAARDFHSDAVAQVELPAWSRGRVVLLGDAAHAAGPGGNGTGTALVGAYVLAGELSRAPYPAAFAAYERTVRPWARRNQQQATGGADFLAPADERAIRRRDRFFRLGPRVPGLSRLIRYLAARTANAVTVPEYELPAPRPLGAA